jgi:hypothetical protein
MIEFFRHIYSTISVHDFYKHLIPRGTLIMPTYEYVCVFFSPVGICLHTAQKD